ncbi:MAG: D-2-hydroxyacid dehydrogenase [Saprospiraceae bacterium]|nr:D-2-hydroxyacid dehydrogenase [Saprospiraceae bacterium]
MPVHPNIVFLDFETTSKGDLDISALQALGALKTYPVSEGDEIIERSEGVEIIICNKTRITKEVLSALPRLKYIVVAATGYNNIDLDAAKARGVKVSNVRGYSTTSVVQHVYAMLLAYLNQSQTYFNETNKGKWSNNPYFAYWNSPIEELAGKAIGILGFGTIGQAVARVALTFGMKVIATHRHPERDQAQDVRFVEWETLCRESDVLTLHAPLNSSTMHIINSQSLSMMNSSAILINTARGGLIDEQALADALERNQIQAALLDVLSEEPPHIDHPLIGLPNCMITPHQAWASRQARQRLVDGIVVNIKKYLGGRHVNVVC